MSLWTVRTEGDALVYMIDCTLATITQMAMRKSRPVGEFNRQISIAQKGLRWAMEFKVPLDSRPKDVAEKFGGDVNAWATDVMNRYGKLAPRRRDA